MTVVRITGGPGEPVTAPTPAVARLSRLALELDKLVERLASEKPNPLSMAAPLLHLSLALERLEQVAADSDLDDLAQAA